MKYILSASIMRIITIHLTTSRCMAVSCGEREGALFFVCLLLFLFPQPRQPSLPSSSLLSLLLSPPSARSIQIACESCSPSIHSFISASIHPSIHSFIHPCIRPYINACMQTMHCCVYKYTLCVLTNDFRQMGHSSSWLPHSRQQQMCPQLP